MAVFGDTGLKKANISIQRIILTGNIFSLTQ